MPGSLSSRRRVLMPLALAAAVLVTASGCVKPVTSLDDPKAKELFVGPCTRQITIENGQRVETELASRSYCECVWNDIRNVHKISDDTFKAWQDQIEKGENLNNPPDEIRKAMDACAGPVGPSPEATTTTAQPTG